MINKGAWKIFIFATAVVMLLLRPYFVYQMTTQKSLSDNPAKAYNLLQRLVKKKDDHHNTQNQILAETRRFGFRFLPPVKSYGHFYLALSVTGYLHSPAPGLLANTIFRIRAENHRYRLLSCFQV